MMTLALLILAVLCSLLIAHAVEASKALLGVLDDVRQLDARRVRPMTLRLLSVALGVVLALWLGPQAAWLVDGPDVPGGLWWVGGVGLGLSAGETARWLEDALPAWREAIHRRVLGLIDSNPEGRSP